MDPDLQEKIKETVTGILETANMEEMTEYKVRKEASEKLGVDLSVPECKKFVREVVESYIIEKNQKEEPVEETAEAEEEEEEKEADKPQHKKKGTKRPNNSGRKEYTNEGDDFLICKLADKRKVSLTNFKGKTLVSIREYYEKDGKELPGSKGISLTAEQWASFYKNVPAIEQAIDKMNSTL